MYSGLNQCEYYARWNRLGRALSLVHSHATAANHGSLRHRHIDLASSGATWTAGGTRGPKDLLKCFFSFCYTSEKPATPGRLQPRREKVEHTKKGRHPTFRFWGEAHIKVACRTCSKSWWARTELQACARHRCQARSVAQ